MRAVGAHAGENHCQHSRAPHRSRRREQRIDRGPAEIDRRVVAERNFDDVAFTHDAHVAAARRQIDAAGENRLAVLGLMRAAAADAPQVLGQYRSESGRHVLRDQHRRTVDRRGQFFK